MSDWLTPIQKIMLTLLIAAAVGGVVLGAIVTWAESNKDIIVNPDYTSSITRTIDEVMA